jgi:hypothetical protein
MAKMMRAVRYSKYHGGPAALEVITIMKSPLHEIIG